MFDVVSWNSPIVRAIISRDVIEAWRLFSSYGASLFDSVDDDMYTLMVSHPATLTRSRCRGSTRSASHPQPRYTPGFPGHFETAIGKLHSC